MCIRDSLQMGYAFEQATNIGKRRPVVV